MKKIKKILGFSIGGSILPFAALAVKEVSDVLSSTLSAMNTIIKIMFALAVVIFGWGIIQYMSAGGDEEKIKQGKQHILWGIIGMALLFGVWGFAAFIANYFGVTGSTGVNVPQF
ncbi:MAG TPA: hypothetical protein ENL06_00780 [Candidatus Portnoybacteria bacterium]|nr:hypothetical protein [Candidatus Portnoybacteria bacterium]